MWLCVVELHHNTVSHPSPHPPSPPTSEQGWETQEAGRKEGRGQASKDGARGVGTEGRSGDGGQGERQVVKEEGSVAKEIGRTWGKDRAGQGCSEGGRAGEGRYGCRVRQHTHI